jgi:hypothetical protein
MYPKFEVSQISYNYYKKFIEKHSKERELTYTQYNIIEELIGLFKQMPEFKDFNRKFLKNSFIMALNRDDVIESIKKDIKRFN